MNVVNGTKPTLESRLAELDGKLATATKFWQRAAYQRHVEGRIDAIDAIKTNRRMIADLEREREELVAALAEVEAASPAGQTFASWSNVSGL